MGDQPRHPAVSGVGPVAVRAAPAPARHAYADNLKVALVCGVIIAHVTMAWADFDGAWVFSEPPVREPLLTLLKLATVVGVTFGMPVFFLVAGMFTPASLDRKGLRRFAVDRTARLLVPSLLFVLLLTPPIEFVDPDESGWTGGFWAFVPHVWSSWPPAPGPTWFLGVLWVFSLLYGGARTIRPRRATTKQAPHWRHLLIAALAIAVASYLLRIGVPLGREVWHLALAQAPAWAVGFGLGVLGGERSWFRPLAADLARGVRRVGWTAMTLCVLVVAAAASTVGTEVLFGGGTWQSFGFALLEGTIVVTVSPWLLDLFRRRFARQGKARRELSRAAYAAFLVHQLVLVGLVLASHQVSWPPELEYLLVAAYGVVLSFAAGALLARLPGMSRIV